MKKNIIIANTIIMLLLSFFIFGDISITKADLNKPNNEIINEITDYTDLLKNEQFNLSFIRTKSDFAQKNLSAKEIEKRIKSTIQNKYKNKDTYYIEIPMNTKKFEYLGFKSPAGVAIPKSKFEESSIKNQLKNIKIPCHICKYDDFYFLVQDNSIRSRLLVFFGIRAVNILKYRYTKAYKTLIQDLKKIPNRNWKNYKNIGYLNKNKAYVISFLKDNIQIASNLILLDPNPKLKNIKDLGKIYVYENIQLIKFNAENIKGYNKNAGSRCVYQKKNLAIISFGICEKE